MTLWWKTIRWPRRRYSWPWRKIPLHTNLTLLEVDRIHTVLSDGSQRFVHAYELVEPGDWAVGLHERAAEQLAAEEAERELAVAGNGERNGAKSASRLSTALSCRQMPT